MYKERKVYISKDDILRAEIIRLHHDTPVEEHGGLSQMATYWFVIAWFDNQSVQKSEVRQAAKDVVKSEVYPQTYSS